MFEKADKFFRLDPVSPWVDLVEWNEISPWALWDSRVNQVVEPEAPSGPRFLISHRPALALLAAFAFAEAFEAAWYCGDNMGQAHLQFD